MATDFADAPAAELLNQGTIALRAGENLLNSGFIVVSALMFIIGLLVIALFVIYRDKKETETFLREMSIKTLNTLGEVKAAITALAQRGGNGGP